MSSPTNYDQNLGKILVEILTKIPARSQNLGGQKLAKILAEILAEISGRSQNLGSKKLNSELRKLFSKASLELNQQGNICWPLLCKEVD